MTNGYWLLKRFTLLVLSALCSLNAWAGLFGFGGDSWKEEVLLHDGNKLVVGRSVERGGRHEIGQKPSYTKQMLTFTHPTTGEQVVWEDLATPDLGNSNFLPMALDIYQGAIYLVANPMGCLAYNKWGRPKPPYVVFRYGGKAWERVPLQELPQETKALNLIFSSPDTQVDGLGKRFIDADTIKRLNTGFQQPEFKALVRTPIANEDNSCPKSDFYGKAGWLGPDWFTRQPSLEACLQFCGRSQIEADLCPCKTIFLGK